MKIFPLLGWLMLGAFYTTLVLAHALLLSWSVRAKWSFGGSLKTLFWGGIPENCSCDILAVLWVFHFQCHKQAVKNLKLQVVSRGVVATFFSSLLVTESISQPAKSPFRSIKQLSPLIASRKFTYALGYP